jgi:ABC-type dipeptide/oligopeptide/nickel transport system ATPase component
MKIVQLTAENVKKLVAVEITPRGEIVTIAGRNGAGKTSVLDSIWWALAGAENIQAQPIRAGAQKARIRLNLGELVVERRFTANGSSLIVENAEGLRFPSPQKMLDALLGELSFDPLAFSRMPSKAQFEALRKVAKITDDLDALDAANRSDYMKRTELNRELKAQRSVAETIIVPEAPAERVDETALLADMQRAADANTELERERNSRRETGARLKHFGEEAAGWNQLASEKRESLKRHVAKVEAEIKSLETSAAEAEEKCIEIMRLASTLPPLREPTDLTGLRKLIDDARGINQRIDTADKAREHKARAFADVAKLESRAAGLTTQINARTQQKAAAIAASKMPIPGLGFGEGVVLYDGVPFEQASSALQLRVSMAIAIASNPKLRVIRVSDGSLLDEDSLAAIADMAREHDFQVWLERVDSTGRVGIVIEDGAVASTPESRAAGEEMTKEDAF